MSPRYHLTVFAVNHRAENFGNSNAGVKETRLKNLLEVVGQRGWRPADLVREVGKSPSYWSDMLRGAKGFGEDVAREIEDKLQLPRFWLDTDHERGEVPPEPRATPLGEAVDSLARAIAQLPKLDRRQIAALLPLLAEEPESRADTAKALMRLLAPSQPYEYTRTWEECAKDAAEIMGDAKMSVREFVERVDKDQAKYVRLDALPTTRQRAVR